MYSDGSACLFKTLTSRGNRSVKVHHINPVVCLSSGRGWEHAFWLQDTHTVLSAGLSKSPEIIGLGRILNHSLVEAGRTGP